MCSEECRRKRRRKLARARRRREIEEQREDEGERQRQRRARVKEREQASGCHAPPSGSKPVELQQEIDEIVDQALSMSRARLRRSLPRMLRKLRGAGA